MLAWKQLPIQVKCWLGNWLCKLLLLLANVCMNWLKTAGQFGVICCRSRCLCSLLPVWT